MIKSNTSETDVSQSDAGSRIVPHRECFWGPLSWVFSRLTVSAWWMCCMLVLEAEHKCSCALVDQTLTFCTLQDNFDHHCEGERPCWMQDFVPHNESYFTHECCCLLQHVFTQPKHVSICVYLLYHVHATFVARMFCHQCQSVATFSKAAVCARSSPSYHIVWQVWKLEVSGWQL